MAQPHLIDRLGGAKAVADALRDRGVGIADVTVRSWTLSGRNVPGKYWTHLVAISAGAVSFEELASAAEYRPDTTPIAAEAA
jgi:hypothetical protein